MVRRTAELTPNRLTAKFGSEGVDSRAELRIKALSCSNNHKSTYRSNCFLAATHLSDRSPLCQSKPNVISRLLALLRPALSSTVSTSDMINRCTLCRHNPARVHRACRLRCLEVEHAAESIITVRLLTGDRQVLATDRSYTLTSSPTAPPAYTSYDQSDCITRMPG